MKKKLQMVLHNDVPLPSYYAGKQGGNSKLAALIKLWTIGLWMVNFTSRHYVTAMQEISTCTSFGNRLTSTVSRAGGLLPK